MVIVWSLCLATANANADRKYLSAPSRRMKKMKQCSRLGIPPWKVQERKLNDYTGTSGITRTFTRVLRTVGV